MFNSFYNFKTNPFTETPNTHYFFKSKDQTLALRSLANRVDVGQEISVLTGEIGTGKTILCRVFLKICQENYNTGLVLQPKLNRMDLLRAISEELGVPKSEKNRSYYYQKKQLSKHLSKLAQQGQKSILVIDEAQHLTTEGLESLCLLNDLEWETKKLLHIVLAGQPELKTNLSVKSLEQLRGRISSIVSLHPMVKCEISDYIHHRIFVAGGNNYIRFDQSAIELISKKSQNIPRLVNIICQHSIDVGEETRNRVINANIVKVALKFCPSHDSSLPVQWMTRVLPL